VKAWRDSIQTREHFVWDDAKKIVSAMQATDALGALNEDRA